MSRFSAGGFVMPSTQPQPDSNSTCPSPPPLIRIIPTITTRRSHPRPHRIAAPPIEETTVDRFELPEDLTDASREDLDGLEESALAEFDDLFDNQPRTSETIERMREIRDGLNQVREARAAIDAVDAEVDEMADEVRPAEAAEDEDPDPEAADPDGDDTGDDTSDEDEEEEPAEASETSAAPAAADASATPTSEDEDLIAPEEDPTEPATSPEQEPATVAASSAPSPSATALNAHRGNPDPTTEATPVPAQPPATIVAAANLPNHNTGADLSMEDVASAFNDRFKTFPKNGRRGQMRAGVAVISKPFSDTSKVPADTDATPFLDEAANETLLPNGSLVAAGGWCAPSETIYDLCSLESTDGILSLPSVQVSRGGIRHTLGPDFRAIYTTSGFTFDETADQAGDYDGAGGDKPCVVVPCPDFTDDRLEVAGLCITSGILQDTAYPEVTRRFVEGALVGHGHRVNELVIESLVAGSTAVSPTAFGGSTTSILGALELVAEDVKYGTRMARSTSLEVVFPFWARGLVRADLSNRLGINMLDVTDAMIAAWMRERQVNPQFVYDWQDDLADGASGFGASTPQTAWPDSLDFLIYPAGTWVKGESDVITMDAIYDSVNLPQNNFTALFTEEGWMTMKRCHDSRIVTVAGWNAEGDTNAGTTPA